MKDEKVSVVVPIYNVEEFLPRCLDSILAQTYNNIEVLLVDDGSPDGSGEICDRYAIDDSRIRVFHIVNGGVAKARQLGVESSTGDYIVFVDPDDWLPLDSIECLYNNIDKSIDLVIGSFNVIAKTKLHATINKTEVFSGFEFISRLINLITVDYGGPWGKLYRRSLFTENSFPRLRRRQDWLMNIELGTQIRGVKTIPDVAYNYVVNKNYSVKKLNIDFEFNKQLCGIVENTLKRAGLFNSLEREYRLMQLRFTHELNIEGVEIPKKDKWVKEMYDYLCIANISLKEKLFLYSIKNRFYRLVLILLLKTKQFAYRIIGADHYKI